MNNVPKQRTSIELVKLFDHYKNLNASSGIHSTNLQNKIDELEKVKLFSKFDFSISEKEIMDAIRTFKEWKIYLVFMI